MNRYKDLNNKLSILDEITRNLEEAYLIEMSVKRSDAMDKCMELGEKFIEHFNKIYNENNENTIHHHAKEMQSWLSKVLKITLKPNGKYIPMDDIIGWFIEGGTNPEDYFTGPDIDVEREVYVDFYLRALTHGDVLRALKEVDLYNGE